MYQKFILEKQPEQHEFIEGLAEPTVISCYTFIHGFNGILSDEYFAPHDLQIVKNNYICNVTQFTYRQIDITAELYLINAE